MNNRTVMFRAAGGPEVLEVVDADVRAPSAGELVVRHTAVGVNFIDIYHRTGAFPLPALPAVPGVEGVGVVEAVGVGVEAVAVGQRVAYIADAPGSYATRRVLPAARAVALPEGLTDHAAAALLFRGVTAHMLVRRSYPVAAGEVVVVHAASGGVGALVTQWAKHLGATVIATVSRAERVEAARLVGADHVLVLGAVDLAAEVRRLTGGQGAAAVFDGVGRTTFEASLASVRPFGTIVSFGQSSGSIAPIDPLSLGPRRALAVARPGVFAYTADRERLHAAATDVLALGARGVLAPTVGATFELGDAALAHRAFESGAVAGAILLVP